MNFRLKLLKKGLRGCQSSFHLLFGRNLGRIEGVQNDLELVNVWDAIFKKIPPE